MIFLVLINLVVLFISSAIFLSLTKDYQKLYLLGLSLSLGLLAGFTVFKYGVSHLTLTDSAMILYRGGLILALCGGALACFIATELSKKK